MLVTYASRTGSTAEIGLRIAEILHERGVEVYASPMHGISQWEKTTPVIVGSAVRFGGWLPEAVRFVKTYGEMLQASPVATYSVGIMPSEDDHDYLRGMRGILQPWAETTFKGRLDPTRIGIERSTMLRLKGAPFGDYINWQAVEAWADHLYQHISAGEWS